MASLVGSWHHGNLLIPSVGQSAAVNVTDDLITKFDGSSQRSLMVAIFIYRSRTWGEGEGVPR